jgi:hypothetical protein
MEDLLKTLIEKIDALDTKVDSLAKQSPKSVKKEWKKPEGDGKVKMDKYKKSVLVTGDTFPIKNTLSENGGKWNKSLSGWVFTNSHLQEVVDAIKEDGVELVIGDDLDVE